MPLTLFVLLLALTTETASSEPITVGEAVGAQQPQLAVDSLDVVHLTFGAANKVYYARWEADERRFSEPVAIGGLDSLALGMRRGPRIASTDGRLAISAIGKAPTSQGSNVVVWTTSDGGAAWQGPTQINDVPDSAREGLHAMAGGPDGELFCVWLDLRNRGTQIYGSRSADGGATWSTNRLVYESPDGTVCECCHPSVVIAKDGRIYVMWRNSLDGNRDMYIAESTNHGETFLPAVKIGEASWPLEACPMDGGALAVGSAQEVSTIWRRDNRVLQTEGVSNPELPLGEGMQPWIASRGSDVFSVWLSGRAGDLYLHRSARKESTVIASNAEYPVIAAPTTAKGRVVVAWETQEDSRHCIKAIEVRE